MKTSINAQITQTATVPFDDLHLVRADIPPVLVAAQKAPYAVPIDRGSNAVSDAAGTALKGRSAFLKGLGHAAGCQAPGAPRTP